MSRSGLAGYKGSSFRAIKFEYLKAFLIHFTEKENVIQKK